MTVKIEKFAEDHLEQVARIESLCFAHPWSENSLRAELTNELARFFAAVDGESGTVLGYIGMYAVAGGGYITNVAVLPEYRKNGIGEMLVKAELECAENEDKLDFVTLEVRPSNTGAIHLYAKNGFKEAGKRKGFYRDPPEDGLIMTVALK